VKLLGKSGDTVITKGNCILVHRKLFRGHSKVPELGSLAELSKLTRLLDQLGGNYVGFSSTA